MEIYVHQHNIGHIVNDKEFNEHLTRLLKENSANSVPEINNTGEYFSTVGMLDGFFLTDKQQHIANWFKKVISDYAKEKGIEIKSVEVLKTWCNRIFRGVKGMPHNHWGETCVAEKVLILYYQVPVKSSDFVIIDSKEQLQSYEMYDKDRLHFIPVRPGMAILHDINMMHAFTEHNSDDPRTCFVFDIKINTKT
jgi:hypothetical protein